MRWRSREGPWGSHQLDARALKCETSVGSTVPVEGSWFVDGVCEKGRDAVAGAMRCIVFRIIGLLDERDMHCRIERAAIAGLYGFIV